MRMPDTNNHRRRSVAGQRPRQPERGVQKRNDHEDAMKKTFISDALALLLQPYPAHASAQQAASADKAEQSHKQIAEASFMAENQATMGRQDDGGAGPAAVRGDVIGNAGHASQDGGPPACNAAR